MRREPRVHRVTMVIGESLNERIHELAAENERTVSDFLRIIVKEYLEALDGQTQIVFDDGEEPEADTV